MSSCDLLVCIYLNVIFHCVGGEHTHAGNIFNVSKQKKLRIRLQVLIDGLALKQCSSTGGSVAEMF